MSRRTLAAGLARRGAVSLLVLPLFLPALCPAEPITARIGDLTDARAEKHRPFRLHHDGQHLLLEIDTSRAITLAQGIPRVQVNDPEVLRATPLAADRIGVTALKPGRTKIRLWDAAGQIHDLDVTVHDAVRELETQLKEMFPTSSLRVRAVGPSGEITGEVDSPEMRRDVIRIAEEWFSKVVNQVKVLEAQTVELHLAVLEISLTEMEQEGFDWKQIWDAQTVAYGRDDIRVFDDRDKLVRFINRLKRKKIAKVLATPTLMTISKRPAKFESGTECPVEMEGESLEYKFVGTQVEFLPTVFADGRLRLETRLDVFDKDSLRDEKSGRRVDILELIPTNTRSRDPIVDFRPGQTLVVRGRPLERVTSPNRMAPLVAAVPLVGAELSEKMQETEQFETVLIVTPQWQDADAEAPQPEQDRGAVAMISDQGDQQTR